MGSAQRNYVRYRKEASAGVVRVHNGLSDLCGSERTVRTYMDLTVRTEQIQVNRFRTESTLHWV